MRIKFALLSLAALALLASCTVVVHEHHTHTNNPPPDDPPPREHVNRMASTSGWDKLGQRRLDLLDSARERESISVSDDARFSRLMLRVARGSIRVDDLVVVFDNGERYRPALRVDFNRDNGSFSFDLPGWAHEVRRLDFRYFQLGFMSEVTLELWGKPAPVVVTPPRRLPPPETRHRGWDYLGSRQASFSTERDSIPVSAREGRFTAIMFEVEEGDLDLYELNINFGAGGGSYTPNLRLSFREGSRTGTIDFPGDARVIDEVRFRYRSTDRRDGNATIHLYGKPAPVVVTPPPRDPPRLPPVADRYRGWEHLGTRTADHRNDRDTIVVGRREGYFTAIRVEVEDNELELSEIKVTFGDGQTFEPRTRHMFDDNTRTRDIDLPGNARIISKVEFKYRTFRVRGDKSVVNLYGKPGRAPEPPKLPPVENRFRGWEYLGSSQADFRRDNDTITVGAREGYFSAIKLEVEDADLELYNVAITYGDGRTFSSAVRYKFDEDTRSRDIDLPGDAQVIKKVFFHYKTARRGDGRATVNVYGKPGRAPAPPPLPPVENRYRGWEHLGTRKAEFRNDKDTIVVGAREGHFTAIKIEVEDADLQLFNVKITFGDGESFSPRTRYDFDEGTRTRDIDPPGNARVIKQIEFHYKSTRGGRDGRATVNVYGKPGRVPTPPALPPVKDRYRGWEHLGARKAEFRNDKDTITVGAREGHFSAIKIEVEDADIEMFNVKITFGDGATHSPNTRYKFDEGTRTRDIDLPGDARVIKQIDFHYKTDRRGDGRATVNVYGKPGRALEPTPAGNFTELATSNVGFRTQTETMSVTDAGAYKAIRLEVSGRDLEMSNLKVYYTDGDVHEHNGTIKFKAGSWTKDINLPGRARAIKKIEFKYEGTRGESGRAKVTLSGKK